MQLVLATSPESIPMQLALSSVRFSVSAVSLVAVSLSAILLLAVSLSSVNVFERIKDIRLL